jgi:membrane protein implicated in regulation of membrane protease activity
MSVTEEQQAVAVPTRRRTAQSLFLIVSNLLVAYKWPLCIMFVVWVAVPAIAGKTTVASISVLILFATKVGAQAGVPWVITAIAGVWALLERRLRRKKTEYLSKRIERLERKIDPKRSSSGLLPSGDSQSRYPLWK